MSKHTANRFTANSIEDVRILPSVDLPKANDRSGQASYRPFEEIGSSLRLGRQNLKKMTRTIDVEDKDIPAKVDVNRLTAAAIGYTYVPPVSTLGRNGASNRSSVMTTMSDVGATFSQLTARFWQATKAAAIILAGAVQKLGKIVIVAPLLAAVAYAKGKLFTNQYDIDDGLRKVFNVRRATVLKSATAIFVILAGVVFVSQLTEGGSRLTGTNRSNGDISSNSGTSSKGQKPTHGTSATSDKKANATASTGGAPAAASNAPAGSATAATNGGSGNTSTSSSSYPNNNVGYGGGGSSLPATGVTSGSVPALPGSSTVTAPIVNAIPYQQATIPATTQSSDGKTIYSTSPITVTSN